MRNTTFQQKKYMDDRWLTEHKRLRRQGQLYAWLHGITLLVATLAVVGAVVVQQANPTAQDGLFALAAAALAFNVLYGPQQRSRRAVGISKALQREHELFETRIGLYESETQRLGLFVQRCERILQSEDDGQILLLPEITVTERADKAERQSSTPPQSSSPFSRSSGSSSSSGSSLRRRFGSNRLQADELDDDEEYEDNDEDDTEDKSSTSRFGSRFSSSPFSGRSSSSPFGKRTSGSSPFGGSSRFAGGRPVGSSGGMRRKGNDDPALSGIGSSNGRTGMRVAAYYPKELSPNQWQPVKAYIFMGHAQDAVIADAENGEKDKVAKVLYDRNADTRYRIPEGARVTVTPHVKGFQFNPQSVNIQFYRAWHRLDFEMRAVDARLDEATNGTLTFSVEGLVLADVPLSVYVQSKRRKIAQDEMLRWVIRKPYRTVYASFADEDAHIAERLRPIYDAMGMYTMRDRMQHRTEQGWHKDMLQAVDEAEVFQLFWSRAAANSESVERELERALARQSEVENFVRVVYWEQPPAALPDDLRAAHQDYLPGIAE